jgi:hypothetical protein
MRVSMEGKGTPKNEQNQFCHSPSVKAMTPSEVERQDSHAAERLKDFVEPK